MQSGDKIDSLEVTIALEIVSHLTDGSGGFKKRQKPRFGITLTKTTLAQFCATKIILSLLEVGFASKFCCKCRIVSC